MIVDIRSVSSNINADIDKIDSLIGEAKENDSENTMAELNNLLIEYILAAMSGDSAGAKAFLDQISSLLNKFSSDMKKADGLVDKLKTVANDPSKHTATELSYLQGLIEVLKKDAISGEMDGF